MDALTENRESREKALKYQVSWISEYVPHMPLGVLEMIVALAFNAGVIQGLDEGKRILNTPLSKL